MRCVWCHNPESQHFHPEVVWHRGRCLGDRGCIKVCPEGALTEGADGIIIDRIRCAGCARCVAFCPSSALEIHGRTIGVNELFDLVAGDVVFYTYSGGGVTLSGGEPLSQPEAAIALLKLLHDAKIHTAVDTCGVVSEAALRKALEFTDLVLLDIKTTDEQRHLEWTGVPFANVAAAAGIISASGVRVWVRTPIIPGHTEDEALIRGVARFVAETFEHCDRHELLAFSNLCVSKYEQLDRPWPLAHAPLLGAETMERLCAIACEEGSMHAHWSGPLRSTGGAG